MGMMVRLMSCRVMSCHHTRRDDERKESECMQINLEGDGKEGKKVNNKMERKKVKEWMDRIEWHVLHEELCGALHVHEQAVHALDVLDAHLRPLPLLAAQRRHGDHLDRVAQRGLHSDLGQQVHGVFGHLHVLLLASDLQDPFDLLLLVPMYMVGVGDEFAGAMIGLGLG